MNVTRNEGKERKRNIGIFYLTECSGFQNVVSNFRDRFQKIVDVISDSPEESKKLNEGRINIALVAGQVTTQEDLDKLEKIRKNSKNLVAVGTCACEGMPTAVEEYGTERNEEEKRINMKSETVTVSNPGPLSDFVEVDYFIRGCPPRGEDILYFTNKFDEEGVNKNEELEIPTIEYPNETDLDSIITLDPEKCILCRRCITICNDILGVHAIGVSERGPSSRISTSFDMSLDETDCIYCGQCISNCSVGAFDNVSNVENSLEILEDESNYTVVVIDPVALSSAFSVISDEENSFKNLLKGMISILRDMGADKVLNYRAYENLSAIAHAEALEKSDGNMIVSFCPSGNDYIEEFHSEYENNIESNISPEAFLFQDLQDLDEEDLKVLFITPCLAQGKNQEFDSVLFARELPEFFRSQNLWVSNTIGADDSFDNDSDIGLVSPFDDDFDYAFSPYVLNIAHNIESSDSDIVSNLNSPEEGVIEYNLDGEGNTFSGLIVSKLSKIGKYLDSGKDYDIIELTPCPKGCLTGGGQNPTVSKNIADERRNILKELGLEQTPTIKSISRLRKFYQDKTEE